MNKKNVTQVHHTTDDELVSKILKGFDERLLLLEKNFQPKEPVVWITRKQVSELLSVSLVTVSEWSKKGILKPVTIGSNRVRFNRNEVVEILTKNH